MSWCGPLWVLLVWDSELLDCLEVYFLCQIGKFSFIIFSSKLPMSYSSSSPSGTPIIRMLGYFKMSWRFLSLSSFFLNSCFFFLSQMNVYFFPLFQIVDLNPSFCPFSFGSLYIFLYFTLYSLHFFLYFAFVFSHFCEHHDHQCFGLCI